MKAYLFLLLFFGLGLTSVFGQTEAKKQKYVPGEIIVKFQPGVLDHSSIENQDPTTGFKKEFIKDTLVWKIIKDLKFSSLRKLLHGKELVGKKSLGRTGIEVDVSDLADIALIKVEEDTDLVLLCEKLRNQKHVIYAEPNGLISLTDNNPNDPAFVNGTQWSLEQSDSNNPNFDRDIDAARAWDFQTGASTIKVAIIDTGIDYHHQDLGFGTFGAGAKVAGGYDYVNSDYDPDDDSPVSHGTACAGIIGAFRNNLQGMSGIAGGGGRFNRGVSLYAIKVAPATGPINIATVASGIIEASVNSPYFGYACHILNLSLGDQTFYSTLRDAIRVAAQNNVVIVAAKGNDGANVAFYPADVDSQWILSVGATVKDDTRNLFSNFGSNIDVVAPGFEIYTTARNEVGQYTYFENTSAATPHVAGLAALIKSTNSNLHAEDVQGIIKAAAEKVGGVNYVNGFNDQMGFGRINAGRAMEMLNSPWQMTHATATGGTIFSSTSLHPQGFTNSAGGPLNGTYNVRRHEVRKQVTVPLYSQYQAWGRGTNASTGWGAVSPVGSSHYQMGYSNVVATTSNFITLSTYVYEVYTLR